MPKWRRQTTLAKFTGKWLEREGSGEGSRLYVPKIQFYYGYILFALLRKQEKRRLQLIFVSILHAGHYQICIKILNKIQIPVPKLAVTLVMGRIQNMDRGPWTSQWIWSMDHPMDHP